MNPHKHRFARAVFRRILRATQRGADCPDMERTVHQVLDAAFARGRIAGVCAVIAECFDLVPAPLRRDPLSPPRPRDGRFRFRGLRMLPSLHDWRTAARRAFANPGYAAVVIAVLALGIAVNTVVFSVADAAMFRGLPYPNGPRLFEVFNVDPAGRFSYPGLDPDAMMEWHAHPELFDAFEGWNYATFVVVGGAEPAQIGGAFVTPGLFAALGLQPARGRLFQREDAESGRNQVVIVSDGLWRQRFAADPDVTGRTLTLNDRPYTVVGVMAPHFRFPAAAQQVWLPTPVRQPGKGRLQAVAILKAGLAKAAVQERLDTLAAALAMDHPRTAGWKVRVAPSRGVVLNDPTRQALRVLTWAVFVVLLIACANVANLFFAQALARSRELGIRAALGASRGRLVRELLAESLLLGGAGGLLGLALAYWGIAVAIALAPTELTRFTPNEIRIDQRMLAFTAAVTLGTGLLFGILPAWRASRAKAGDALKGRTGTSAVAHARLRGTLVVSEVALSCLLLTGAGLLIHSFTRLQGLDPGFTPEGLMTVPISLPTDRYPAQARRAFLEQLQQIVSGMPGVDSVTVANGVPTSNGNLMFGELEAEDGTREAKESIIPSTEVAPSYFKTLGIPLRAGRSFTADEPETSMVISEGFARRLWPEGTALGRRFRLGERGDWLTVVGIASEVIGSRMVERQSTIEMYSPIWQPTSNRPVATRSVAGAARSFVYVDLIVRAARPLDLVTSVKQAVWAIDPVQPVGEPVLVEHLLANSLTQDRFAAVLMGTFAALALVLAAAGLYAVLAQLVAQRRQEIGIRIALGAAAADVARLILSRGLALTAIGIAIGMAGAWSAARVLSSQLFEIAPHDPWSFGTVPVALLAIALLASWMPARRALSVDPASALRTE